VVAAVMNLERTRMIQFRGSGGKLQVGAGDD